MNKEDIILCMSDYLIYSNLGIAKKLECLKVAYTFSLLKMKEILLSTATGRRLCSFRGFAADFSRIRNLISKGLQFARIL